MRKIYLDNSATTYVSNEVLTEMLPVFNTVYGNPNSLHGFGREALALLDAARDKVAAAIGASRGEIYFTSGGTEANNWAIRGLAIANSAKGNHIITSKIEHHSVLEACKALEKIGFKVTYLDVDKYGLVSIPDLLHYINDKTVLVSIMAANNEIGTVQNLQTIAKIAHEKGVVFHTDAVQAIGAVNIDVGAMNLDALSLSAHKIYGPKGIGVLYVKKGIKIEPIIYGGSQEKGKRGGTSNVAGAVGLGKAIEIAVRDLSVNSQKLKAMREYFVKKVSEQIEDISINGHPAQRLPGVVNISFHFIEGESLMLLLDMDGIAVSTGSACSSGSLEPSHVLVAIGTPPEYAQGSIRFSFGKSTTREEVDYVVESLKKNVKKLREMSPLNRKSPK
ncbi:MAG: cysteine desulfurase NifS [Christensenellaceae bacterium]|jgi:cysteine desulfurase|nr:cysteine desulfurase NifS [Christensenellaceae bacterium]